MPVPRLDILARRHAAARTGDGGRRALFTGRHAPRPNTGSDVGPARVCECRWQGAATGRGAGRPARPPRSLPLRDDALRHAQGMGDRLQLEDLRRQLSRRLPRGRGASGAAQGARLRQLRRRAAAILLDSARAAARRRGRGTDRRYDPSATEVPEAVYAWLFPNMMLNVYLGQMQTNVVLPLGHDRCRVVFAWYAEQPPEDAADDPSWTKLLAFSDEIQNEDIEICETVQRNLRSRVYDRGRYSAKRENGVHHFHSLLHEFLT